MNFPQICQTFLSSIIAFFIPLPPPSPPQPETASMDIEHQPVQPPSQPQFPSQLEPVVQNHQQWQNAIVGFCFSYALGVSLQSVSPGRPYHRLPLPTVLLSFLVLLVFIFILLAFFIHPKCTMISQALQKAALLFAATAFCHTLSIPFSIELKCAIWALFSLCLLAALIFTYLNINKA